MWAAVDLAVGRRLARTAWRERLGPRRAADVERVVAAFERHGAAVLLVNRFVPGVRALFFVAAGVAGVRTGPALLASAGSALAWNALLVGAGTAVGWNLEVLAVWVGQLGRRMVPWLTRLTGRRQRAPAGGAAARL